jgi:hypothetical protein
MLDIFLQLYVGYLLDIYWVSIRYLSGIYQVSIGYLTDMSYNGILKKNKAIINLNFEIKVKSFVFITFKL